MSTIKNIILAIRAIPKTIYFNFKYFKLKDAIRFPVIVSHRVVFTMAKGKVKIDAPIKFAMIRIGFGGVRIFDQQRMRSVWYLTGTINFKGSAHIGNGTKLSVLGELILGNNFAISANTQISCYKKIQFGDDVLIGWDCIFIDSDAHKILNNKKEIINPSKEIVIGNKVWFGFGCKVLKGSNIGNDIVVASNSSIFNKINANNCIIGGYPTRILKENITWEV